MLSPRVAHVVQCGPTTGGTVSHVALQVKYQVLLGIKVLIVAGADGVLAERTRACGGAVIIEPSLLPTSSRNSDAAVNGLADRFREHDIDIIHSHLMHAGMMSQMLAGMLRVPHVYTQHMFTPIDPFIRVAKQRSSLPRLITVAESFHEDLQRFTGSNHPVHVVPNGVDRPTDNGFQLRPGKGPKILYCGRLSPEKGADTALLSFAQILSLLPEASFHVVGTGPDEVLLTRMTKLMGLEHQVEFYGSVSGALHPGLDADVVLVPSRGEAASLVVMEAMASRIPIVASHVGGTPHLVADGAAAALVPPDDPTALTHEAVRIITDREARTRYTEAAFLRYDELFQARTMVERTLAVYREALAV